MSAAKPQHDSRRLPIPQEAFDWYDEYAHGYIDRRTFIARLSTLGGAGLTLGALLPVGGYPGNDDQGRSLQRSLDRAKIEQDFISELRGAIRGPLLVQLAELDQRVNATWPEYEQDLKDAGAAYTLHVYPGSQHGFHNDSTARYDEAAAELAWQRTLEFFGTHLGG